MVSRLCARLQARVKTRTDPSKCGRTRAQRGYQDRLRRRKCSRRTCTCARFRLLFSNECTLRGRGRALHRSLRPRWVGVGAHAPRTRAAGSAPTLAYLSACPSSCPRVVARRAGVHVNARSRGSPKRRRGTARGETAKTKRRAGARRDQPRQTQNGESETARPKTARLSRRAPSRRFGSRRFGSRRLGVRRLPKFDKPPGLKARHSKLFARNLRPLLFAVC